MLTNLYKVQLESYFRPVYAFSELNLKKKQSVVLKVDEMEQFGEIIEKCNYLIPYYSESKNQILRLATDEDIAKREEQRKIEIEAFNFCKKTSSELGLSMRLVKVHHYFDSSKIIFYYTAESRVDFRELVKILARTFKMRIEMRQIGVRDETKLLGGMGHCGLELCCGLFLREFAPVSVKMAKDQGLTLNPTKISGMCGRLMCCLRYEIDVDKEELTEQEEEKNLLLNEDLQKGVENE